MGKKMALKGSEQFTFYIDKSYSEAINEFRWQYRFRSLSEALCEIVKLGLKHLDEYEKEE